MFRTIPINGTFRAMATAVVPLPGGVSITWSVVFALLIVAIAAGVLHRTRFGRTAYAIGGSESSAMLIREVPGQPAAQGKQGVLLCDQFSCAPV